MTDSASAPRRDKSAALASFERMLASGKDSALLRFSIGNEYAKAGDGRRAVEPLAQRRRAGPAVHGRVEALRARTAGNRAPAARRSTAYRHRHRRRAGARATRQAEKEMTVFARRIERALGEAR